MYSAALHLHAEGPPGISSWLGRTVGSHHDSRLLISSVGVLSVCSEVPMELGSGLGPCSPGGRGEGPVHVQVPSILSSQDPYYLYSLRLERIERGATVSPATRYLHALEQYRLDRYK